jgi:hypothetical protein
MRRVAIGLALVALVGLAACTETSPSSEPRTKNAALATTTTPTPASTTILATTTTPCVISMTGNVFKACKPYKRIYYKFFSGQAAISGELGGYSTNPAVTWTEENFASGSMPTISVKVALDYADGTKMPWTQFPLDLSGRSPRVSLATGAACVPVMDRVIFRACKPYKRIYYKFFSGQAAISGGLGGYSTNPAVTWTEENFASRSLPTITVKVALDYADGTKMPETLFPIDLSSILAATVASPPAATTTTTTTPKAAPTTTVNVTTTTSPANQPTCTISWDGARLTACKQFRELRYQYFGANGPLSGQLGASRPNNLSSSNISMSPFQGSKSVRISIPFLDGSAVSNVDVAIGATVDARFSALPTPTTAPSGQPGCDLSVRFGAITPTCRLRIRSYTYQWHDGVKTISGTMGASSNDGWQTVFLGSPPKGATGALMTFVFMNNQKTRSVLIPLTAPNTITVRALY